MHEQPAGAHDRQLLRLRQHAEVGEVDVHGHRQHGLPHQHQVQVRRLLAHVARELVEEAGAALLALDAAHVDDVVAEDVEPAADLVGRDDRRVLDPHAHDLARQRPGAAHLEQQVPLLGRVEGQGGGKREQVAEDPQADRVVLLRRGHQDALARVDAQAVERRPVAVREEDQDVVVAAARLEVVDEPRRDGAVLLHPAPLFVVGVVEEVDLGGELVEALRRAAPRHRKASHGKAGHPRLARLVDVLPREVVHRARGQHLHRVPLGEVLRDPAGVQLRPADDLLAEALDDEPDPHRDGRVPLSRSSASQRWRSACSSTCSRAVSRTLLWRRWAK